MSENSDAQLAAALPGYEVGEILGRGGYGVVRLGRHRQLGRTVAIKQIPTALASDPEVRIRFVEEARALASFDHPHIVRLYDYVERDELCLLVMEHLRGGSVADVTAERGLTPETACAIALVTCAGLHYAHQHGILHRDVKPENALYSDRRTLKVTDFGIAKVVGGRDVFATTAGELLGTPAYMAPEQASGGELGPAADVYATGTMLYELLSGRLPFSEQGGGLATVYRHVYEHPVHLQVAAPQVPARLADVVMRAIARDLPDRYETAEAFGVALGHAATIALGSGWLDRSEVALLAPGPILESASTTGQARTGAATGATTAPVRRTGTAAQAGRVRASAVDPAELVPVREALKPQKGLKRTLGVAVGLAAATALAALTLPLFGDDRSLPEGGPRVDVGDVDLSSGETPEISASDGVQVRVQPTVKGRTDVRLKITAAGVPVGRTLEGSLDRTGGATLMSESLVATAGGKLSAELQLTGAQVSGPYTFTILPTWKSRLLPAAVTVALVLFCAAYAEALLRPVRRRRRARASTLVGMAGVGAGAGVATVLAVWVVGWQPLTVSAFVVCALLAAGAAVAATKATAARARERLVSAARAPRPSGAR